MTDGPMVRARKIIDAHIIEYGNIPRADMLKDAIAAELGLVEIIATDRAIACTKSANLIKLFFLVIVLFLMAISVYNEIPQ